MDGPPQLPPELWVCVFRFLSTEEKHAVRSCCRLLRGLVDHPSLWKDHTVVLSDLRRYTYGFWDTLNRRRLTRVAVRHLDNLHRFPDLRDLGVRNATWDAALMSPSLTQHLRARLTHLGVCNVRLPSTVEFVGAVSELVNLRSLLFHHQGEGFGLGTVRPVPRGVFHRLLLSLRKLQHLSWGMKEEPPVPLPDDYLSPPDPEQPGASSYGGPALRSLVLVDYPENALPENALRSLVSLRSLTVHYRYIREGMECRLSSWLSPLHQLQSLTIIGGNSLSTYTTTIPPTVTRLTLRVAVTLKDLDSVAPKVPGLQHLDIEQNRSSGSLCRRIPMLFPQLRTLRIRFFRREPEKDLLSLVKLRHLQQLELLVERFYILRDYLNGHPWPSPNVQDLINQIRELSENRITVITAMRQRDPLRECDCVWEGD